MLASGNVPGQASAGSRCALDVPGGVHGDTAQGGLRRRRGPRPGGLVNESQLRMPDHGGREVVGKLEGKVAFITGAARGQGRSHAVWLARAGADIIAVDLCEDVETVPYEGATEADLAETVKEVEALDRRIVARKADVRDYAGLKAALDEGVAELGRLDIVSANAGIFSHAPAVELTEEQWGQMIDINLTGVWRTCKAAVPHLVAGGRGGSIIITSS